MPSSYIYKAEGDRGKKGIFLTPQEDRRGSPVAVLSDGTRIPGRYVNTNEGRHQYLFGDDILGQQGVTIEYNGQNIALEDSNKSYEGNNPYDGWEYRAKGDLGSGGGGSFQYGGGGNFTPGSAPGGFAYYPGYLGDSFPSPVLVNYNPISAAPYKFTDVKKFAQKFGGFNREQIRKNFDLSKDLALEELNTELQGLESFVPAASALKRTQIAKDNIFNQDERTAQVDRALPGVRGQLDDQAARADAYARGRAPDDVTDRALELNVRSAAADRATAGGFGSSSSVARKASDLMSAETRIGLSQYGDQLTTSNIATRSNLYLAPTEYSDAGGQVRVSPEVGAGRLAAQALSETNANTLINPATGLANTIQQEQFTTSNENQTRQFNASNQLSADSFNASTQNQFGLTKFQYDVGYAGAVAGAYQTDTNTQVALQQQQQYQDTFSNFQNQAQNAQQIQSIAGAVTAGAGLITSIANAFKTPTVDNSGAGTSGGGGSGVPLDVSNPTAGQYDVGTNQGGSADSIVIPTGGSAPDGYTPVMTGSDGNDVAIPDSSYRSAQMAAPVTAFTRDTGIAVNALDRNPNAGVTQSLLRSGSTVLNTAGIYNKPVPGAQAVGYTRQAQPIFSNNKLAASTDVGAGASMLNVVKGALDPMGVFNNPEDASAWDQVATASQDVGLLSTLTAQQQAGDTKGFVNTLLSVTKQPLLNEIGKRADSADTKLGVDTAFSAYQVFQNWDRMSPAQQTLAVASIGMKGFQFAGGENLASKVIIPPSGNTPGLTVGGAMGLLSNGINAYSVINNWSQLNNLQKIAAGSNTLNGVATLAHQYGLLGSGTTGAAVPGITQQVLQMNGLSNAPSLGIGAVSGPAAGIPEGYQVVQQLADGNVVAVPSANISSAAQTGIGSTLSTVAGVTSVVLGAKSVYDNWGKKAGPVQGLLGGSAMAGGLYTLGATNPYLLAGVVAFSLASSMIKTGKEEHQVTRDAYRSDLQQRGMLDDKYQITLADGSQFDMGQDGSTGIHQATRPDQLTKGGDGPMHSYDVDYTNDLDYATSMGCITLSRLMYGGAGRDTDSIGGQLTNAAISSVGYNQEMTPENYAKSMENTRAFYAQGGIKSADDAKQLANMAFAEGRMDATEHATALQAIDLVYNPNSYSKAQQLMAGRWRGIETAAQSPTPDKQVPTPVTQGKPDIKPAAVYRAAKPKLTKEQVLAMNRAKYSAQEQQAGYQPNAMRVM